LVDRRRKIKTVSSLKRKKDTIKSGICYVIIYFNNYIVDELILQPINQLTNYLYCEADAEINVISIKYKEHGSNKRIKYRI